MANIVQVINAMILNKDKISNVLLRNKEYFFLYNFKYKWSIRVISDEYFVHLYPSDEMTIEELSNFDEWTNFAEIVTYSTKDIKTQEAIETFRELFQIVSNKVFGLDDIFDDIINS